MSEKIKYADEPIGGVKVIPDFLPSPDELAYRDDSVKVTIALSRASVEFFKRAAKKRARPYQKIIRKLLDAYSDAHHQPVTRHSKRRVTARS